MTPEQRAALTGKFRIVQERIMEAHQSLLADNLDAFAEDLSALADDVDAVSEAVHDLRDPEDG